MVEPGFRAASGTGSKAEQLFGDYCLESEIARGGMGVVYQARQISLNRAVALKLVATGQFANPALVQRFQIEAAAAAQLDHPCIVPIYEIGEHRGQVYYSMKLVEGGNLAQLSAECRVRSAGWQRAAAGLLIKIAEAVHYAHQHGVLHRDLKPANILMDGPNSPRVTDFGLAKVLEDESGLTLSTATLGTPAYMAPEQAAGRAREVSTAADVYSLGAILYELLTGRPPFQAESPLATMRQVLEREPTHPSVLNASVAADLETICLKCIEKDPAKRYPSAHEFAEDLAHFLHSEPILARPVSRAERAWRWCKRKPLIAGLVVALHLAFALGLAGVLWQWHRAVIAELMARQHQYVSDMNLVQQVWEDGNLERAQALLRAHIPKPGQPDLRGLEWRYLWKLCRDESLHTINRGESDSVSTLVSSPNHGFVAGLGPGIVTLFDGGTGRELDKVKLPTAGQAYDETAGVPESRALFLACASGATNLLATKIAENSLVVLDVAEKQMLMQFSPYGTGRILGLALSPNGRLLATMSDRELKLWDISSQTNPPSKSLWTNSVQDVSPTLLFTPDGKTVVAFGKIWNEGSLGAWDAQTGLELAPFPREHIGFVFAAVFSPDGQLLAASGWDGRIVVWDFPKRKVKAVLTGHVGGVMTLAMASDGHRLISAGLDNAIRIWDLDQQKQVSIRRGHSEGIESIAFAPDGKSILSTSGREIKWWRVESDKSADILDTRDAFVNLALSPDGKRAVTMSIEKDRPPQVWEVASRSKKFELARIPDHGTSPRFSPDGHLFAAGCEERSVRLWNTHDWEMAPASAQPDVVLTNDFEANYLAFSPDSKILAVAGITFSLTVPSHSTNRLAFWDLGSRKRLHFCEGAGAGDSEWSAAASVEFSKDRPLMAVGFRDGAVRLWDTQRQRLVKEFKAHTGYKEYGVCSLSFSSDGHWLASCAGETMVLYDLWRLESLPPIRAHTAGVRQVYFAPGNRTLISAGGEGRIKFWNLATGEVALTLKHSDGPNMHFALTREGNLLASIDAHGILKFWPIAPLEDIPKQRNEDEK